MHFAFITGCDSDGIGSERGAHWNWAKALMLLMKGLTFLFTPSAVKYILFACITTCKMLTSLSQYKISIIINTSLIINVCELGVLYCSVQLQTAHLDAVTGNLLNLSLINHELTEEAYAAATSVWITNNDNAKFRLENEKMTF